MDDWVAGEATLASLLSSSPSSGNSLPTPVSTSLALSSTTAAPSPSPPAPSASPRRHPPLSYSLDTLVVFLLIKFGSGVGGALSLSLYGFSLFRYVQKLNDFSKRWPEKSADMAMENPLLPLLQYLLQSSMFPWLRLALLKSIP